MADPVRALNLPARTATIYPPPYAAALEGRAKRALGDVFNLTQFGVNLTTLAPGASSAQLHWHENEDEFIYVLEGELTLVDGAGEERLTAGMCVGFKAAVPNGHKLVNNSTQPCMYLEIGTRSEAERVHYPDSDMLAVKVDGKFRVTRKDGSPF